MPFAGNCVRMVRRNSKLLLLVCKGRPYKNPKATGLIGVLKAVAGVRSDLKRGSDRFPALGAEANTRLTLQDVGEAAPDCLCEAHFLLHFRPVPMRNTDFQFRYALLRHLSRQA